MLTIVTYHYVRDLSHSRYPRINGLETSKFEGQLEYIARHYKVVRLDDVAAAVLGKTELPANSCLLTFDDGLLDHYLTVFPRLASRGWSGCFFPVSAASGKRQMLDVHKIQLILSVERDTKILIQKILEFVSVARKEIDLPSDEVLWARFARSNRYEGPDHRFVKNALQYGLPQVVRRQIVQALFVEYIAEREDVVARELYMDLEQMRTMARAGMAFGGHGLHEWLGSSTTEEQQEAFRQSRALLAEIYGRSVEDWTMCYPYGSYNAETVRLAQEAKCCLGLTLRGGVAHDLSRPLELPRLDTTQLAFCADAPAPDLHASASTGRSSPAIVKPVGRYELEELVGQEQLSRGQ